MSEIAIYLALLFILFGSIGILIGQRKGRAMAGLIFAILLGPIGWLLIFLGPDMNAKKSVKCPHCDGIVPIGQSACNHCGNKITWIQNKAYKPSRLVTCWAFYSLSSTEPSNAMAVM